MRKFFIWSRPFLYFLLFTLWLIWYSNVKILSAASNVAFNCQRLETYPVGLVLGARAYNDNQVSPIFSDRLITAADLYNEGKIENIIVSGDHGSATYDEVTAGRNFLLDQGIPGDDIFLDHAGFDTYDSVYRAQEIFKASRVLIITQRFHLPRALYFAEERGLLALGCVADKQVYENLNYFENREILARVKGWLEAFVKRKPKYLGETIDLQGSGKLTWDDYEPEVVSESEFDENLKKDFLINLPKIVTSTDNALEKNKD
ncbi:MAG: ElyC/SanA/YdcF family protein [Patescibacteria group bacterium]|nr:ElyC/SanA/YdcF family protein [Patescibacteria group bacterium]